MKLGKTCVEKRQTKDSGRSEDDDTDEKKEDAASSARGEQRETDASEPTDVGSKEDAGSKPNREEADGGESAASPACTPKAERCNGADDDCDGQIDEDPEDRTIGDACSNGGDGPCADDGEYVCFDGKIVCDAPPAMPTPEMCDGVDNDCKNGADDGLKNECGGSMCNLDTSTLGKSCTVGEDDCAVTGKYECDPTAANNALRCSAKAKTKNACGNCSPLPVEECDGADNDCDGKADEGLTNACGGNNCRAELDDKGKACSMDQGECSGTGTWACDTSDGNNALKCNITQRKPRNLILDSGFEQQSGSLSQPWTNFKGAFISSDAHQGTHAATVVANEQNGTSVATWNDINQVVTVVPNTSYKLEAWVKTSANLTYGRIGTRAGANFATEVADGLGYAFSALSQFTYVSTRFTVPAGVTQVDVYIGGSDNNGAATTVIVDDVAVTREALCP